MEKPIKRIKVGKGPASRGSSVVEQSLRKGEIAGSTPASGSDKGKVLKTLDLSETETGDFEVEDLSPKKVVQVKKQRDLDLNQSPSEQKSDRIGEQIDTGESVARTSRRSSKKQAQKMAFNSMLLILASIGIIVALLVWGVPAIVNLAGVWGEINSTDQPIEVDDGIGPFAPQLAIAYDATASASINISGFANQAEMVLLFNNGEKVNEVEVESEGEYSFEDVTLVEGENEFWAVAVSSTGKESEASRSQIVVFDDVAPELSLESPEDGAEFFGRDKQRVDIIGVSEPGVTLYVKERLSRVDAEGKFSKAVLLESGDNEIKVEAIDAAGNKSEVSITVKYFD